MLRQVECQLQNEPLTKSGVIYIFQSCCARIKMLFSVTHFQICFLNVILTYSLLFAFIRPCIAHLFQQDINYSRNILYCVPKLKNLSSTFFLLDLINGNRH